MIHWRLWLKLQAFRVLSRMTPDSWWIGRSHEALPAQLFIWVNAGWFVAEWKYAEDREPSLLRFRIYGEIA